MLTGNHKSNDRKYEKSSGVRNDNDTTFDDLMSRANEYLKKKKQRSNSSSSIIKYIQGSFNDMMNGRPVNCPEVRKRITPEESISHGYEIQGTIRATYNESYSFGSAISSYAPSFQSSASSSCSLTDGYVTTGSCRPH